MFISNSPLVRPAHLFIYLAAGPTRKPNSLMMTRSFFTFSPFHQSYRRQLVRSALAPRIRWQFVEDVAAYVRVVVKR
jgi:hypothetical protein